MISQPTTARPAIAAAFTLGIGLGGYFDGIVFHQTLQAHNMLSGWIPVTWFRPRSTWSGTGSSTPSYG